MKILRRIASNRDGSVATEFGLIAPLLIALTVAVIEFIFVMFTYQAGVEAARAAVREVLVGNTLGNLGGLADGTDVLCTGTGTIANVTSVSCTNSSVYNSALVEYQRVADLISARIADVSLAQIEVRYSWPSVSYLENLPGNGSLVTPVVSVEIVDYSHEFVVLGEWIGATGVPMPPFTSSRLMHTIQR